MNYQFISDVKKAIKKEPLNQVLPPGSPRRYDPPGGVRKHNERIHKESKIASDHKDLPFTFSKPKKTGRSSTFSCDNCGYILSASVTTVGVVCPECKKFATVTEVVDAA